MDAVGVGLALISVFLFMVTLGFSTGQIKVIPSGMKSLNTNRENNDTDEKKFIIVKLPGEGRIPDDYTFDLKVSFYKGSKDAEKEKSNEKCQSGKNLRNRLDEYLT